MTALRWHRDSDVLSPNARWRTPDRRFSITRTGDPQNLRWMVSDFAQGRHALARTERHARQIARGWANEQEAT